MRGTDLLLNTVWAQNGSKRWLLTLQTIPTLLRLSSGPRSASSPGMVPEATRPQRSRLVLRSEERLQTGNHRGHQGVTCREKHDLGTAENKQQETHRRRISQSALLSESRSQRTAPPFLAEAPSRTGCSLMYVFGLLCIISKPIFTSCT